jgi:hypothetical protein
MAVSIPATDQAGTALLAVITAGATGISSTQHINAINSALVAKQRELMDYLIANNKISYTSFMANLTYGA